MTKIVAISDTHCMLNRVKLPDGDILVHAGDALSRGTLSELIVFLNRLEKIKVKYAHVVYVPGNHDRITELNEKLAKDECAARGIIYLNDSGINLLGIEFWGSAVTPRFRDWAWNRDSEQGGTSVHPSHPKYNPIKPHWDLIPDNVDVLITHGPPYGVLDKSVYDGALCGCQHLMKKVLEVEPKYHIFVHIHEWHGKEKRGNTTFVNASNCTEQYKPINEPIVLEI